MWTVIARKMLRSLIRQGNLTIHGLKGGPLRLGDGQGPPLVVHLSDPGFARRLVLNPELAIGEAYMEGALKVDNDALMALMTLGSRNLNLGTGLGFERFTHHVTRLWEEHNPIGKAQANVAHHYDLTGALYDLFLDDDRQYSCAYFRSPDDSLDTAQAQKKAHIAQKLCLQPGQRVLDIGCGWGGMALTLAQDYGVDVVGVTLSREQHKIASERVAAAGLEKRIDIRLQDYREVSETFNRIVSIGMFEHVGRRHFREFFGHVNKLLSEDGVALIHTIGRGTPPGRTSPWITKYIFPGGYLPALSEISTAVEHEGFWITDVEVWRLHYAETLRHWRERFCARIDEAEALYDERFCRMWLYYLIASEVSFRETRQPVFQLQLSKRLDTLPLTRDYMYPVPGKTVAKKG